MKLLPALAGCLPLLGGMAWAVEFEMVFPADALEVDGAIQATLAEAFPDLKGHLHERSAGFSLGVFSRRGEPRVLLHLSGESISDAELEVNGRPVARPFTKPLRISLAMPQLGEDGLSIGDREVGEEIVGYWIPMKKDDELLFQMTVASTCRWELRYQPEEGWRLSKLDLDKREETRGGDGAVAEPARN